MNFLKNLKLSLRAIADISTIIAVVIGFYALINPGAVSDYLREISEASAATEVSLQNIDTSSAATADNTSVLVEALPTQFNYEMTYSSQRERWTSTLIVTNPTSRPVRGARLLHVPFPTDAEGRDLLENDLEAYLQQSGKTVELSLPPFQKQDFTLPGIVFMTCMEYASAQQGGPEILSDVYVYDRDLEKHPDPMGYVDTYFAIVMSFQTFPEPCPESL